MRRHSDKYGIGVLSELNVTPLLDLAFVLLVIFMISAPLLSNEQSAEEMGEFSEVSPNEVALVKIGLDKSLTIQGQGVDWKDLPNVLEQLSDESDGAGVLVESHRNLPVQDLMQLMGAIREAGFRDVGVVTEATSP